MSKILKAVSHGQIITNYTVEPTLIDVTHETFAGSYTEQKFVTKVAVTTYWDGDISVSFGGVDPTKAGKPHKGRNPEPIYLYGEDAAKVLADLGIDATVAPVIAALEAGPQDDED